MPFFTLQPSQTILLIVDMQEKIFAKVERGTAVLHALCQLVKGFQILSLPILISEQYPQGLGATIEPLKMALGDTYSPWIKSTFSCLDDNKFFNHFLSLSYIHWIVVGIEAHVCVLQTVKGLLKTRKKVTVLNDVTASYSVDDFSTAIVEMREAGARISCVETILFELMKDSSHPHFKSISNLIKICRGC